MSDKKQAAPDFTKDPYWGKGGRYVVNPDTGLREPAPPAVDEAEPAAASGSELARESAPAAPNPPAEADLKKHLKERNRA